MPINSLKWDPTNVTPEIFSEITPLLDRTHTPRGVKKLLTLERSFDKDWWIPNRMHVENFGKIAIGKDLFKGKMLERYVRRKKRAAR